MINKDEIKQLLKVYGALFGEAPEYEAFAKFINEVKKMNFLVDQEKLKESFYKNFSVEKITGDEKFLNLVLNNVSGEPINGDLRDSLKGILREAYDESDKDVFNTIVNFLVKIEQEVVRNEKYSASEQYKEFIAALNIDINVKASELFNIFQFEFNLREDAMTTTLAAASGNVVDDIQSPLGKSGDYGWGAIDLQGDGLYLDIYERAKKIAVDSNENVDDVFSRMLKEMDNINQYHEGNTAEVDAEAASLAKDFAKTLNLSEDDVNDSILMEAALMGVVKPAEDSIPDFK